MGWRAPSASRPPHDGALPPRCDALDPSGHEAMGDAEHFDGACADQGAGEDFTDRDGSQRFPAPGLGLLYPSWIRRSLVVVDAVAAGSLAIAAEADPVRVEEVVARVGGETSRAPRAADHVPTRRLRGARETGHHRLDPRTIGGNSLDEQHSLSMREGSFRLGAKDGVHDEVERPRGQFHAVRSSRGHALQAPARRLSAAWHAVPLGATAADLFASSREPFTAVAYEVEAPCRPSPRLPAGWLSGRPPACPVRAMDTCAAGDLLGDVVARWLVARKVQGIFTARQQRLEALLGRT